MLPELLAVDGKDFEKVEVVVKLGRFVVKSWISSTSFHSLTTGSTLVKGLIASLVERTQVLLDIRRLGIQGVFPETIMKLANQQKIVSKPERVIPLWQPARVL